VLLNSDATQCQSNADCARFGQTSCDMEKHVCRAAVSPRVDSGQADLSAPDAAVSCQGSTGCFQCSPGTDPEFLSACTDSTCIPFDNGRLTNLNSDGTLKPIP